MTRNFARFTLIFTIVLSLSALAQTGTAAAATPAGTAASPAPAPTGTSKVGIIDVQGAIVSTNEGQREFQSLQKKFDPKRSELETLNKEVEDLKKQLNTQGDKLNDDARNSLVKQIESKQKILQRNYEDANNDITAQQNEIANRIGQKMMEVLDKYAKDNNYGVILNVSGQQNAVIWAGSSTDLTAAIVEAYNVKSGVPAPPPGSQPAGPTGAGRPGATTPRPAGATPQRPATTTPKPATPK
jgi:outer membrane protein